jgi:SAM-dependent methyltransferase
MGQTTRHGDFEVRRCTDLPDGWVDGLIPLVEAHQVKAGTAHFRTPLPDASGEAFVKVFTRRPNHGLARRAMPSRAVDEVEACERFREATLPVHEPLCVGEHRVDGLWERSFVASRAVPGAEDYAAALVRSGEAERRALAAELGGFLGRIHAEGLCHGDARAANFVRSARGPVAIDVCQSNWGKPREDLATLLGSVLSATADRGAVEAAFQAYGAAAGEMRAAWGLEELDNAVLKEAERESLRRYGYKVIGAKGAHDALRAALDKAQPCTVLDAPAGEGILSEFLRLRGWNVHCADIDKGNFRLPHLPLTQVDLNRALPFADATFDAVVCANALHRLYNPAGCVRELARVVRPGGRVYINVNNYASLAKRLRFLLYGSIDNQVNSSIAQQSTDAPEANLRVALHVPMMAAAIEKAGLVVEKVAPSAMGVGDWLLSPLALFIRTCGLLVGPRSRKRNALALTNGWGVFPGGKYLLIVARKPG